MSRQSFIAFLLIASFGILFVGCAPPEPEKSFEDFTFTEQDLKRTHELLSEQAGSGSELGSLTLSGAVTQLSGTVTLDLAKQQQYDQLRAGVDVSSQNIYMVSNSFLNIRSGMSVSSSQIAELNNGDTLIVTEIPNAAWAKVKLMGGQEGYASFRYIAKLTTDEKLGEEKKKFENQYYVNYQFLNVRKDANSQSEKIGQLNQNAIVKPLSMSGEWARVTVDGKEGYVSSGYLAKFEPVFIVRQNAYALSVLQFNANEEGAIDAMSRDITALKAAGKRIVSLQYLYDLVLSQQSRDVRVTPNTVVLTVSNVQASNVKRVSDTLISLSVPATLFIKGKDVGLSGITEKMALTLLANGFSLQAQGHTGDDLRALTDSQVELELAQSKKLLEEVSHKEVYAVSYPQGAVNDRVMKKAAQVGYLFGLTQVPSNQFDRTQFLRLPSQAITAVMTAEDVVGLVK